MKLDRGLIKEHPYTGTKSFRVGGAALRDDDGLETVVDEGGGVVSFSVEMALGGVEKDGPAGRQRAALGITVHPLAKHGVGVVGDDGQGRDVIFGQRTLSFGEKCLRDDALLLARFQRSRS